MRSTLYRTLIVVMISWTLIGNIPDKVQAADNAPLRIRLGMASVGGAWHAIAEGLAEVIRRNLKDSVVTVVPGGIAENQISLEQGKVDFAIGFVSMVKFAREGEEPYNQAMKKVVGASNLYPMAFQPFGCQTSKYANLEEIFTKKLPAKLSFNRRKSLQDMICTFILQQYGVTKEEIEAWGGKVLYMSGGESLAALKDRSIDMLFGDLDSYPASLILQLKTACDAEVYHVGEPVIAKVCDQFGLAPLTIPAGTYKWINTDIKSFAVWTTLNTSTDVPAETVYLVTKAIAENLPYLKGVYAGLKDLTPEKMTQFGKGVPLHAGAKKYYGEKGIGQ